MIVHTKISGKDNLALSGCINSPIILAFEASFPIQPLCWHHSHVPLSCSILATITIIALQFHLCNNLCRDFSANCLTHTYCCCHPSWHWNHFSA